MKKYKAGFFWIDGQMYIYYTEDFVHFYNKDDLKLSQEDLEEWAYWLDEPWSQELERYNIKVNCKDGYTAIDKDDPIWVCEYSIIGYEGAEAAVCGYGNTEIEALEHCKANFQMLQDKYNIEED